MEGKDVVLVKNLEEEFEIDLYGTITEESTQPILQQLKMIKEIAKETILNLKHQFIITNFKYIIK